jgi:transposase
VNSVGIDLHRSRSHVAVIDEDGELSLSRRIANEPDVFLELLGGLSGETRIAVEATYGWEWLAELLEDAGYELHLAHPLRTKAIASARVKTDAVDARTLAHLLRADLLPEAYVAPRELRDLRDLRDLLRQRVVLTQMRTALKNRVHALIARQGIGHGHTDLFGRAGHATLDRMPLRPEPRRRLEVLLRLIADFDREIDALAKEIDRLAKHDPRIEVLTQIRGIGRYIAMLIIAEVGEVERFPSARHLCAWAGLTTTVRSSDGKARLGHISRLGSSTLRWALVEAAQHTQRGGGPLRESFERIAKRRGRQVAKVAVARKMLTLCWARRRLAARRAPRQSRRDPSTLTRLSTGGGRHTAAAETAPSAQKRSSRPGLEVTLAPDEQDAPRVRRRDSRKSRGALAEAGAVLGEAADADAEERGTDQNDADSRRSAAGVPGQV